ncbi:MAG: VCBS repeat-containing protein, partial [Methanomassiliicoccales archaeon]
MVKGRRKNAFTVILAFAVLLSILLPVLGAPSGPSIFRYDEKRTGNSYLVSNIVEPGPRWTFETDAAGGTVPIAGDIDGDGSIEVVWGNVEGTLYAINEDGEELWSFQAQGRLASPPAIGDVDGDGKNEVLIGGSYFKGAGDPNLYALNGEDGSLLWIFSTLNRGAYSTKGFEAAPSLYDITGDGKLDVLIASRNHFFYALKGADGTILWQSQFEHFIRASSPIGDIDNDGNDEIVVGDNHAIVRLFEMDGSVDWEINAGYGIIATPIFEDVDGDGYDEIIFFTYGREGRGIPGAPLVYNHDGSLLWTNTDYQFFYSTPTIYDVDGDGLADILNVDTDNQVLIAYRGMDGAILYTSSPFEKKFMGPGLVTADIDGDGEIEVLVGANPNLFS